MHHKDSLRPYSTCCLSNPGWSPESSPATITPTVEADPSGNVYDKALLKRKSKGVLKLLKKKKRASTP